jgi:hypothetical protein
MKKFSRFAALFVLLASFSAPLLVAAQTSCAPCYTGVGCSIQIPGCSTGASNPGAGGINNTYLDFYKSLIQGTVNSYLVPILIAIAFIVFLFGVYKYFIQGAADEKNREEGRKFVLWGIIGFVIISSVWGLVNIVSGTIVPSSANQNHPNYPTL